MLLKRKLLPFLFILPLFFSGCQSVQVKPDQSEPPQIIKIGLPPTLGYLIEPMAMCADQNSSYDVLLLEKNSYDWINEPVDVIFTTQNAVDTMENTFLVDEISIVIIASMDFPTTHLSTNQLQAIFNTELVTPEQIGLSEQSPITIYGFESGADMAALFEHQYGFPPLLPVDAFLAAAPQLIVENIAEHPLSIGYTLSPTVNDQVKILSIDTDTEGTSIPVIASFQSNLSEPQQDFIRCLQAPSE
jgi:hypothetical protein